MQHTLPRLVSLLVASAAVPYGCSSNSKNEQIVSSARSQSVAQEAEVALSMAISPMDRATLSLFGTVAVPNSVAPYIQSTVKEQGSAAAAKSLLANWQIFRAMAHRMTKTMLRREAYDSEIMRWYVGHQNGEYSLLKLAFLTLNSREFINQIAVADSKQSFLIEALQRLVQYLTVTGYPMFDRRNAWQLASLIDQRELDQFLQDGAPRLGDFLMRQLGRELAKYWVDNQLGAGVYSSDAAIQDALTKSSGSEQIVLERILDQLPKQASGMALTSKTPCLTGLPFDPSAALMSCDELESFGLQQEIPKISECDLRPSFCVQRLMALCIEKAQGDAQSLQLCRDEFAGTAEDGAIGDQEKPDVIDDGIQACIDGGGVETPICADPQPPLSFPISQIIPFADTSCQGGLSKRPCVLPGIEPTVEDPVCRVRSPIPDSCLIMGPSCPIRIPFEGGIAAGD